MEEKNIEIESNGKKRVENSPKCCRDNERLIKAQEEKNQINVDILQILTDLNQIDNLGSNPSGFGQINA